MAKELGISQTQLEHYEDLPISTREIILVELQELSGMTVAAFWELLTKEAKEVRRRKIEKILEGL